MSGVRQCITKGIYMDMMLGPIALPCPLFHYSNRAPPIPDAATCMEQVCTSDMLPTLELPHSLLIVLVVRRRT